MSSAPRELVDFRLASSAEVLQTLGRRLRDRRLSTLMTQDELATRAGVALGAIKKLESTGKVTVQTLLNVARALGLVGEFTDLFSMQSHTSIAAMERHELSGRKRARKPKSTAT